MQIHLFQNKDDLLLMQRKYMFENKSLVWKRHFFRTEIIKPTEIRFCKVIHSESKYFLFQLYRKKIIKINATVDIMYIKYF